jgi:hypothetical protein
MPFQTATSTPTKKQTPGSAAMDRIMGRTPQPTTPAPQKQLSAAPASAPQRQRQPAPAAPQSDIQRWQASAARQRSATPAPQRATPSVDYQRGPAPSGRTDTAMGDEDRAAALQGARHQMEMGSRGVPTRDSEYASALAAHGNRIGAEVTRQRPTPPGYQPGAAYRNPVTGEMVDPAQAGRGRDATPAPVEQMPTSIPMTPAQEQEYMAGQDERTAAIRAARDASGADARMLRRQVQPAPQPAAPATFPGQGAAAAQQWATVGQPQNWLNQSRSEYFNDDLPFFLR